MRRLLWIVWLVVVALVLVTPVLAQEATAVPTPPPDEPPVIITPENGINLATIVYGIIVAVLGGGSVALILTRFSGSKANLDAMEKLYKSFPPETQDVIARVTDVAVKLADILQKITDGLPNEDAPNVPAARHFQQRE